jgi:hypothetical protein
LDQYQFIKLLVLELDQTISTIEPMSKILTSYEQIEYWNENSTVSWRLAENIIMSLTYLLQSEMHDIFRVPEYSAQ